MTSNETGQGPHVDPEPFDLRPAAGTTADVAALCVHGLTGTPYEVRPLAQALAARGVRARGILLPGHGTEPRDLIGMPFQTWLDAVLDAHDELARTHSRVFLVGVSLGGLLSLATAQRRPVAGLVVVGTPLALKPPVPWLIPIAKYLVPLLPKRDGSDIQDPAARARHPGYRAMPLAAVHELICLQGVVRKGLHRIDAPTLVAHGRLDQTANPRDVDEIFQGISSVERERLILDASGHVVPVDFDGAELASRVTRFILDARRDSAGDRSGGSSVDTA